MMHMTFYWGKEMTLLVNSWRTDSWTSYVLSLFACFIASVFYQYLENLRVSLKRPSQAKPSAVEAPLLQQGKGGVGSSLAVKLSGAVMFGVNSGLGYLLMLAVMCFNGGVFLAVVLGLSVGYLFFRSGDEEVAVVDNPCACA